MDNPFLNKYLVTSRAYYDETNRNFESVKSELLLFFTVSLIRICVYNKIYETFLNVKRRIIHKYNYLNKNRDYNKIKQRKI